MFTLLGLWFIGIVTVTIFVFSYEEMADYFEGLYEKSHGWDKEHKWTFQQKVLWPLTVLEELLK